MQGIGSELDRGGAFLFVVIQKDTLRENRTPLKMLHFFVAVIPDTPASYQKLLPSSSNDA